MAAQPPTPENRYPARARPYQGFADKLQDHPSLASAQWTSLSSCMSPAMSSSQDPSKARPIPSGSFSTASQPDQSLVGSPSRASTTARLANPVPVGSPSGRSTPNVQPEDGSNEPLAGASGTSVPGPGPSSLSQALRGSQQSPSRFGMRESQGTKRYESPVRGDKSGYESFAPQSYSTQLGTSPSVKEDIEVLRRHLVNPQQAGSEPGSYKKGSNFPAEQAGSGPGDDEEFSSL